LPLKRKNRIQAHLRRKKETKGAGRREKGMEKGWYPVKLPNSKLLRWGWTKWTGED